MANVIKTVLTYPLDGSNRDFNIPFEYLARKFIVVTLIGVDRKVLTLNIDYRFATRTTISLTKAWGTADGYTTIELRRVTSTTDRLVDFTDGSILRAYDLNVAQIQTMHVAEEARDLTADTIGVNNDGHLDARGRRIVNLANAVDDRDAVPFGQLKTMNQNSWQARNEALQFRNEAQNFRNQAEVFKTASDTNAENTKQWRDDAKGFRDEAEQFKNTAGQYAASAGNSASAAHQSEVNAENSAMASATSADSSKQQADRAKQEADKLGNWNALADAVEKVEEDSVFWKSNIRTKSGNVFAERWVDSEPGFNDSYSSNSLISTYRIGGVERLTTAMYAEGNWGKAETDHATIAVYRRDSDGGLSSDAYFHYYPNGTFYSNNHKAEGWKGAWDSVSAGATAPFHVTDVTQNDAFFVPVVSCFSSTSVGYPVRFTNGIVSNGASRWPDVVLARMEGDNNNSATYQCQMGGGISAWLTSYDGPDRWISFTVAPQSDARLKTVHGQLDTKLPLSNIESMNFVEFTFNSDKRAVIRRGVIAQELQKIDPEYVHKQVYMMGGEEEKEILQLDLTPMTLDALAAIKELSNQVKELKVELKQIKETN